MKKVIFIIPPDNVACEPLVYPPLGLLYNAAILERDNFQVSIYDMREEKNRNIENIEYSEMYGITSATPQIFDVIKISKYLREKRGSYVVIGGHYASWEPEKIQNDFDCVVVGESENVVKDIFNNKITGIVNANKNKPQDINKLPFPARYLLPKERVINTEIGCGYGYGGKGNRISTTLITTRGCDHRCHFCANIPQKIRFRSAENVLNEVDSLIEEYNCRNYKLLDDNFLMNKELKKICEGFFKRGITFRCAARSDFITQERCINLKLGGCTEIALGIETADDYVLKKINKKENIKKSKKAIEIIKQYGIIVRVYLMVGLPGQTKESIEKTKLFLEETKPERFTVSTFIPYPGCKIWKCPEKFDIFIEKENWNKYFQLYPTDPPYYTKECGKEEIKQQQIELIEFMRKLNGKR